MTPVSRPGSREEPLYMHTQMPVRINKYMGTCMYVYTRADGGGCGAAGAPGVMTPVGKRLVSHRDSRGESRDSRERSWPP